jgi:hypothetical protein
MNDKKPLVSQWQQHVIKQGITDASEDELKALKAMKRSKSIT